MAFSSVAAAAPPPVPLGDSAAAESQASIAQDFDTFLTILTTQLQNQDPLSPMDSSEFTDQLVSFASVEQEILGNQNLEDIADILSSDQRLTAVEYLGRAVTVDGDTATITGPDDTVLNYSYRLPVDIDRTELTIINSDGDTVFSVRGETDAGTHDFNAFAVDEQGVPLPPGDYRLQVRAFDNRDDPVAVTQFVTDQVRAVDTTGAIPRLTVGSQSISLDAVRAIID